MRDTAIEKKGMKKLLVLGLILLCAAMLLSFCALQGNAQSMIVGVGYVGTNHDRIKDGRELNGLDVEISAAMDGAGEILLNARYQNFGARVNPVFKRDLRYYEVAGNFFIPGFNHYAIVGASSMSFGERQKSPGSDSNFQARVVGPVTGLVGLKKLGGAVFSYSGTIHPRAVRTERFSNPNGSAKYGQPASTGYELRGTVTHMVRPRFGYSGGYYWRRLAPGLTDHGFVLKTNIVVLN